MLLRLLDIETSQIPVIHHLCDYPFSNPKPGGIKRHFRLTFAYALRPRPLSYSLYTENTEAEINPNFENIPLLTYFRLSAITERKFQF